MTVVDFGNPDRAADRAAEIVPALSGFHVEKWLACIESFVGEVVVGGPVELVGARLDGEVKYAAARLSEFSRVIAALHREFLDGIDARLLHSGGGCPDSV